MMIRHNDSNVKKGWHVLIKRLLLLLLVLLLPLFSGCAETVTDKSARANEVKLTFTMGGPLDFSKYAYYLLISDTDNLSIDISDVSFYFIAPGQIYDDAKLQNQTTGGLDFYYGNYFSTWTDYFLFDTTNYGLKLYNGLFPTTATPTAHNAFVTNTNFNPENTSSGSKIEFILPLSFLTRTPVTLYFMFLVVDKDTGLAPGNIIDSLNVVKPIRIEEGELEEDSDVDVLTPPAAANIQSWRAEVF